MRGALLSLSLFLSLSLAALCAAAQEQAFTNRATDLKDRGATEARTLASLPEGAPVKVLERGGGWTRVEASGQQGWVRVFHLRFPAVAQAAPAGSGNALSGLTSALGFTRETAKGSTVATTGIRGLTPEELKNASPDAAALARLQSYRADARAAESFAREGRLSPVQVDNLEGGRR